MTAGDFALLLSVGIYHSGLVIHRRGLVVCSVVNGSSLVP